MARRQAVIEGALHLPLPLERDLAHPDAAARVAHQEALDAWALWELVGHFVNYRKQSSPSMQELLPEVEKKKVTTGAPL